MNAIDLGCSVHIADYRIICDECQRKYKIFSEKINESYMNNQKQELEKQIDEHDCHRSKDSGCACQDFRNELAQKKETHNV